MRQESLLEVRAEVASALRDAKAVVALESTLIAHGLPWPINLETAQEAERAVREEGAVPATIAIWEGRPTIGLTEEELETLAQDHTAMKASRRDLAVAIAQRRTAATTVAGTMTLAHKAGIRLLATGGIGGAHRAVQPGGDRETMHEPAKEVAHAGWDISADLDELGRTPVGVVCAGAKSIVDIPRTLEILETHGVPVVGYGSDEFPAFYWRSSGQKLTARFDTPQQAAAILTAHWGLGGAGVVLTQPVPASVALERSEVEEALLEAERQAAREHVHGPALTPYLLKRLADLTRGKTIRANQALIIANAQLAARVAVALARAGG